MKGIPAQKTKGDADVAGRLRALCNRRRSAVLATESDGQPYASLVAFALSPDAGCAVFATPKKSTKYANMRKNPHVAMLVDSRENKARDVKDAEAVTILGEAKAVRRGSAKWSELAGLLVTKHPELKGFVEARTSALVMVTVTTALHVSGFQRVTVWEPTGRG